MSFTSCREKKEADKAETTAEVVSQDTKEVVENAEATIEGAKDVAKDTKEAVEKTVEDTKEVVEKTGEDLKKAADKLKKEN